MLCLLLNRTPGDKAREIAAHIREALDQELGLMVENTCLAVGVCEITDAVLRDIPRQQPEFD